MARVTITEVRVILSAEESAKLSDGQIQAAIDTATIIVDRLASADCHSAASLKQVELYLSAHIAVQTSSGGEVTEEKIGDASEKRNKSKDGTTSYLQTAQMLDCSGRLVDFGKGQVLFVPFGGAS